MGSSNGYGDTFYSSDQVEEMRLLMMEFSTLEACIQGNRLFWVQVLEGGRFSMQKVAACMNTPGIAVQLIILINYIGLYSLVGNGFDSLQLLNCSILTEQVLNTGGLLKGVQYYSQMEEQIHGHGDICFTHLTDVVIS